MNNPLELIVIGGSAGSLKIVLKILSLIPALLPIPIIIVIHRYRRDQDYLLDLLKKSIKPFVCEPKPNQQILPNSIYLAPADYHLLIEHDKTFSLSVDSLVNYARPSIDILFESAAAVFGKSMLGVVLSGANKDGANGCKAIHRAGGKIIVQDPNESEYREMPLGAINEVNITPKILYTDDIINTILDLESLKK